MCCKLLPIPEFSHSEKQNIVRYGRYSSSVYQVKGYGSQVWVFLCYIVPESGIGKDPEKTLKDCIEFLNQIPPREKFKKTPTKPKFGQLRKEPALWSIGEKDGNECIIAHLVTHDQENENIWGTGLEVDLCKPQRRIKKKKTP